MLVSGTGATTPNRSSRDTSAPIVEGPDRSQIVTTSGDTGQDLAVLALQFCDCAHQSLSEQVETADATLDTDGVRAMFSHRPES